MKISLTSRPFVHLILTLVLVATSHVKIQAQTVKSSFGKGILFIPADSSFSVKLNLRMQTLAMGVFDLDKIEAKANDPIQASALVRRFRMKLEGFIYKPSLTYKAEFGLSNRDMESTRNASRDNPGVLVESYVKWKFMKNTSIAFGQSKIPVDRSTIISTGSQQFIDRSAANAIFNMEYDIGFIFNNQFNLGGVVFKDALALTTGEGRNRNTAAGEYSYTARLDILPFGEFTDNGDFFESDLAREQKPKIAFGGSYNFNKDAARTGGQQGDYLYSPRDIETAFIDMIFKYRGFSILSEYMYRNTSNPITINADGKELYVYTGEGFIAQGGYLFKNNFEIAVRYDRSTPFEKLETRENNVENYTLGFSKYLKGHSLKLQTDFAFADTFGLVTSKIKNEFIWRFQVDFTF